MAVVDAEAVVLLVEAADQIVPRELVVQNPLDDHHVVKAEPVIGVIDVVDRVAQSPRVRVDEDGIGLDVP